MKRSEIFNCQYPRPFDLYLYPAYKQFLRLQEALAKAWKEELAEGAIGQRNYIDFESMRLDVTSSGVLLMRIQPWIGDDGEEELKFFAQFFSLYNKISKVLIEKLKMGIYYGTSPDAKKTWRSFNNAHVHKLIVTLKIMVSMFNSSQLTLADLPLFEKVLGFEEDFTSSMNDFVKMSELDNSLISLEFRDGNADFYQYPDQQAVSAYWIYASKELERQRASGDDWFGDD